MAALKYPGNITILWRAMVTIYDGVIISLQVRQDEMRVLSVGLFVTRPVTLTDNDILLYC